MMRTTRFHRWAAALGFLAAAAHATAAPEGPAALTLDDCRVRVLRHNAGLEAGRLRLEAARERAVQAGGRPNPRLGAEVENFGGSGEFAGGDAAEMTWILAQTLETSGRRGARMAAGSAERELEQWTQAARRADLLRETAVRFIDVLAAQERIALAEETARLAGELHDTVRLKAEAGKVPALEADRAGVERALSRLDLARSRREADIARERLAELWGAERADFDRADGALEAPAADLPSEANILKRLADNPDLARYEAERARLEAEQRMAAAEGRPDLDVQVGFRQMEDTGDHAFVAGLEIDLPLFGRARRGQEAARYEALGAEAAREAAQLALTNTARHQRSTLEGMAEEAAVLDGEVLPAARRAFETAENGYRQGRFSYLDVLEARRSLVAVRQRRVDALAELLTGLADLERLCGGPVLPSTNPVDQPHSPRITTHE